MDTGEGGGRGSGLSGVLSLRRRREGLSKKAVETDPKLRECRSVMSSESVSEGDAGVEDRRSEDAVVVEDAPVSRRAIGRRGDRGGSGGDGRGGGEDRLLPPSEMAVSVNWKF